MEARIENGQAVKGVSAPVKKNGRVGDFFCCLFLEFLLLLSSDRPQPLGGKVVVMLTLQELKKMTEKPEENQKPPTARFLMEQETLLVSKEIGEGVRLSIYRNGYAVYRVGRSVTVFSIYDCNGYKYEHGGQAIWIEALFFEEKEWYVRLLLEGEDRLAKNGEAKSREKTFSYHSVSEDCVFLADKELTPLEKFMQKEYVRELMGILTKRQQIIVTQYFYQEKTQKEIARELGITQPTVSQAILTAIKRMRETAEKNGIGGLSYAR